jgi:hypothetical protein
MKKEERGSRKKAQTRLLNEPFGQREHVDWPGLEDVPEEKIVKKFT